MAAGSTDWSSMVLLNRFRAGDRRAAAELFGRYWGRLRALTRSRLTDRLTRRVDPEDVVQSVYRSFFSAASAGSYTLSCAGDLWRLLAGIARHKTLHQVRYQTAARRSVTREVAFDQTDEARRLKSPAAIAEWADDLERIHSRLDPSAQRVLAMRLQGYQLAEIAKTTGRSERSVRRALARVRELLTLADPVQPDRVEDLPRRSDREFTLHRMIGAGGMGKVYAATIRASGQSVAVKFARKSLLTRPEVIRRFLGEAHAISRLRHPRIVGLDGFGRTVGGSYFIVMDLVHGPNLAEVAQRRTIIPGEVVRWGIELCEAIEYAHGQGVGHCDLKPANLLLDETGSIRVTDFGLARSLLGVTPRGAGLEGTAPFMAPEQVSPRWGPIDQRTDIYGIGAVLFTLLCGRPPVDDSHVAAVLTQVQSATPIDALTTLRPDLAGPLAALCQRCLAKLPSARFATVRDLRQALGAVEGFTPERPTCRPVGQDLVVKGDVWSGSAGSSITGGRSSQPGDSPSCDDLVSS